MFDGKWLFGGNITETFALWRSKKERWRKRASLDHGYTLLHVRFRDYTRLLPARKKSRVIIQELWKSKSESINLWRMDQPRIHTKSPTLKNIYELEILSFSSLIIRPVLSVCIWWYYLELAEVVLESCRRAHVKAHSGTNSARAPPPLLARSFRNPALQEHGHHVGVVESVL